MAFFNQFIFRHEKSGFGPDLNRTRFSNSLDTDPDPGSAKCLDADPDLVNPAPKHYRMNN